MTLKALILLLLKSAFLFPFFCFSLISHVVQHYVFVLFLRENNSLQTLLIPLSVVYCQHFVMSFVILITNQCV